MEQQQQQCRNTQPTLNTEVTVREEPATLNSFSADIVSDHTVTTNDVEGRQGGSVGPQAVKRNILGDAHQEKGRKGKRLLLGEDFSTLCPLIYEGARHVVKKGGRRQLEKRKKQNRQIQGRSCGPTIWLSRLTRLEMRKRVNW